MWYHPCMGGREKLERLIAELETGGIRFQRLLNVCESVLGAPRVRGSHHIFRTPWPGEPRINLQKSSGGAAKPYQVRQVLTALRKLLRPPEDAR